MGHRTITISDEAYETLKLQQRDGESFTKEILRIAKPASLTEAFGILTKEEADALEKGVKEVRKNFKVRAWQS